MQIDGHSGRLSTLSNEGLGAHFQARKEDKVNFHRCFAKCGPSNDQIKEIGEMSRSFSEGLAINIYHCINLFCCSTTSKLHQTWASMSPLMVKLKDNPASADSEFDSLLDTQVPGLSYNLTFNFADDILPFTTKLSSKLL